jgi:hypothetical protein
MHSMLSAVAHGQGCGEDAVQAYKAEVVAVASKLATSNTRKVAAKKQGRRERFLY